MVVVSGNWVKNVAAYPVPAVVDDMVIEENAKMSARAVLICRPNSHPFQERTLSLDQPVKVGRSVARARATATNAIFDCKVLSRHHAVLWYDNGKFYLQDTKSSNGTFVNNQRLTAEVEDHELSSGDIVQFGVDVIENNRKVTHGCIIATLKLYLPDGKEAKASPSVVENSNHVVPLDELYKLHQIIQEATQREQCLETKLTALQSVVEEARRSADESWQAYVGEERLLSRISALETQLQQAGKNWAEDKYREEILKLQDDNVAYQTAAKEALDKLHSERLQALSTATEQERSRISAEQEIILAKEQLSQAQLEIEELAQKLSQEKQRTDEQKIRMDQKQWDLQEILDAEREKTEELKLLVLKNDPNFADIDKRIIYNDDLRSKEEMLENETDELNNKSNGISTEPNHISLTVAPVVTTDSTVKESEEKVVTYESQEETSPSSSDTETIQDNNDRHVSFSLPEEDLARNSCDKDDNEKDWESDGGDGVDSKTLKYKYQTAQNELKRKIEMLESILESNKLKMEDLDQSLSEERTEKCRKDEELRSVKDELMDLQKKFRESCNENVQLQCKVQAVVEELEENKKRIIEDQTNKHDSISSRNQYEQVVALEEELVVLKERHAQLNEDKSKIMHDLQALKEKYNKVCDSSYDKMYFYVAPLILMILYLVISAMVS